MSTDKTGGALGTILFRGALLGNGFRIRFHGQTLHSLQGSGNGLLIRLGATNLRIQPLINLSQRGVVRADFWRSLTLPSFA